MTTTIADLGNRIDAMAAYVEMSVGSPVDRTYLLTELKRLKRDTYEVFHQVRKDLLGRRLNSHQTFLVSTCSNIDELVRWLDELPAYYAVPDQIIHILDWQIIHHDGDQKLLSAVVRVEIKKLEP